MYSYIRNTIIDTYLYIPMFIYILICIPNTDTYIMLESKYIYIGYCNR